MSTYSDTIAAVRRAAEERLASEAAEARSKANAVQAARQFLETVVLSELEQARAELQDAGIQSEVTRGNDTGNPRCTLVIQYPRGESGWLIFEAAADSLTGGAAPAVIFKKGDQYDGVEIELSRAAVMERIKAALVDLY